MTQREREGERSRGRGRGRAGGGAEGGQREGQGRGRGRGAGGRPGGSGEDEGERRECGEEEKRQREGQRQILNTISDVCRSLSGPHSKINKMLHLIATTKHGQHTLSWGGGGGRWSDSIKSLSLKTSRAHQSGNVIHFDT